MGKIIRNGVEYSGATEDATAVNYNNSLSGLNAQTVQEAIDELSGLGNENIETLWTGDIATISHTTEYTLSQSSELFDVLIIDFATVGKTDGGTRLHSGVITKKCIDNQKNNYDLSDYTMCAFSAYANSNYTSWLGMKIKDNKFKVTELIGSSSSSVILKAIHGVKFTGVDGSGNGSGESLEYSTEEKIVGTWIDGKPIYRKVVEYSKSIGKNSTTVLDSLLTNTYVDSMVSLNGYAEMDGVSKLPLNYCYYGGTGYSVNVQFDSTGLVFLTGENYFSKVVVVVEYTKN